MVAVYNVCFKLTVIVRPDRLIRQLQGFWFFLTVPDVVRDQA